MTIRRQLTRCVLLAGCAVLMASAGCGRHESAAQAQANVRKIEASDDRDVASAQKSADIEAAKEARDVTKERCQTRTGDARRSCEEQADADFDAAKARAESEEPAAALSQPR
jgi:hypothetical protein